MSQYPSTNQYPAANNYPNAIWPPGGVVLPPDPDAAAFPFCDDLGVDVPDVVLGVAGGQTPQVGVVDGMAYGIGPYGAQSYGTGAGVIIGVAIDGVFGVDTPPVVLGVAEAPAVLGVEC